MNGQVSGLQFTQETEVVPGSDSRTLAKNTCFECNKLGKFADFYPDAVEGSDQYHMNSVWL